PTGPKGPEGLPGPTGPQGPSVPGLFVKDAHGALVGVAVPPNQVAMTIGGGAGLLAVGTDGFEGKPEPFQAFYANADCTGQPLTFPPAGAPLFSTASITTGASGAFIFQGVLYYGTGSVTACIQSSKDIRSAADCNQQHGTVLPDGGCCLS